MTPPTRAHARRSTGPCSPHLSISVPGRTSTAGTTISAWSGKKAGTATATWCTPDIGASLLPWTEVHTPQSPHRI